MNFLDKLPKLPFLSPKPEQTENFFALNIDFDKVTASIWTVYESRLHVLNTAVAPYQNGDDFESEESMNSLVEAANLSLDESLTDIMPEPTKLLFGVPDIWLEDENIKPEFLKILKKMVKELGVEPMAYVSTTHAIAHILQKQHGVPLSAILVNVADPLVITIVKGGKSIASTIQTRGKDLNQDVEKALAALTEVEVLPSRILVYGQADEAVKDELASHPWMEHLPFLHLPRVEVLDPELTIQAIGFAGASELNPNISPEIITATGMAAPVSRVSHTLPVDSDEEQVSTAETAGFVEGDIKEMSNDKLQMTNENQEDFVDQDPGSEEFLEQEEWVEPEQQRGLSRYSNLQGGMMAKLQSVLMAPFTMIRWGGGEIAPKGVASGGILSILINKIIVVPIIFLIALVAFFLLVPKAQVAVFVDMKPLENSTQIIADPAVSAIDEASNKIPGKIIETDASGSGDGQATGTKQVGDPAKGKVVVYNATTNNLSLAQGTSLTTSDGKKFTLDTSVQVASKSASAADPPSRSDATGSTASAIGPDGNIAAGADLTVGSYSKADVVAKVDTAFAGGVSKEVQVVTLADQQKLLAQVTSALKKKAQDQLQGKLTGDLKILQESFTETIGKKSYSKNIGDEASKFNLTVNAHYKGTAYSDADLKTLAAKLVQTKVPDPQHYSLDVSQAQVQAEVANVSKDGKLTFNATYKAKLMPKLDLEKLKGMIVGKSVAQAVQILKDAEQQIIGANVKLSPSLPGPFQRLPMWKENISIEVTAK